MINVGVLGATGAVGQRFVELLADHPWFKLTTLAASERSAGKPYGSIVKWRLDTPFPENLGKLYPEYVKDRSAFDCPSSRNIGTPEAPDYKYNPGLKIWATPRSVIVEDLDGNHPKNGKNVLRVDGSIVWDK